MKDKDLIEVQKVVQEHRFLALRKPLEALGYKVDFDFSPVPMYTLKKRGMRRDIVIVNKKYVTNPTITVGDTAIGKMAGEAKSAKGKITPKALGEIGGEGVELFSLSKILNSASGRRAVMKALELADDILDTYGWDGIWEDEGRMSPVLIYLNTGTPNEDTVLYDVKRDVLYIDSWKNWLKTYESKGGEAHQSYGSFRKKKPKSRWFFASKEEHLAAVLKSLASN